MRMRMLTMFVACLLVVVGAAYGAPGGAGEHNLVLLDAVSANSDGVWMDVSGISGATVEVRIVGTGEIQLRGTNQPVMPANNEHGLLLNATSITSSQMLFLSSNVPKWVKCRAINHVSGPMSCYLQGTYVRPSLGSGPVQQIIP